MVAALSPSSATSPSVSLQCSSGYVEVKTKRNILLLQGHPAEGSDLSRRRLGAVLSSLRLPFNFVNGKVEQKTEW